VSHATGEIVLFVYPGFMLKSLIPLAASITTLCATMYLYLSAA
jgi:hypothetical protein